MRGQSGTITAVVNALSKAGVDLGENGSVIPRPKGKRKRACMILPPCPTEMTHGIGGIGTRGDCLLPTKALPLVPHLHKYDVLGVVRAAGKIPFAPQRRFYAPTLR